MGEEGLKKKAEALKLAQTYNEREIPKEVLESFEVPSVSRVGPFFSSGNECLLAR